MSGWAASIVLEYKPESKWGYPHWEDHTLGAYASNRIDLYTIQLSLSQLVFFSIWPLVIFILLFIWSIILTFNKGSGCFIWLYPCDGFDHTGLVWILPKNNKHECHSLLALMLQTFAYWIAPYHLAPCRLFFVLCLLFSWSRRCRRWDQLQSS